MLSKKEAKEWLRNNLEVLKDVLNNQGANVQEIGLVWFGANSHAVYINDRSHQFCDSGDIVQTAYFISGIINASHTIEAMKKRSLS